MNYVKRSIESKFMKMSASHKAVLLYGARQVGKTTMLRHLQEKNTLIGRNSKRNYVCLDNMIARDLARSDPAHFFQLYKPPVLIDEIQYAPGLFEWIKDICDERPETGLFWLTSSQWNDEMKDHAGVLGTRLAIAEMHSLSRREAIGMSDVNEQGYSFPRMLRQGYYGPGHTMEKIFDYIWLGGMPEACSEGVERRTVYYDTYIDNQITKDATYLSGVTDALRFRKFITAAATHNGLKLNYKILAEAAGISQPTAKEWMSILEGLGIVYLLQPYQNDALKRLVKTAKMYFQDTGLCAYLAGWHSPETLRKGEAGERYLANYIIMELIKNYGGGDIPMEMTFYRNAKAREISLLLEEDQMVHPFEIRLSSNPDVREVRKFNILDKAGIRRSRGGVICPRPTLERIHGENYFIPCDMI